MDENARVQAKLELMKFHQEQLKLQRGTMDTWFKYYLLIVGGPLAVLGATANSGGSGGGLPLENLQLWSTVALLLFAVGFIFLAMHTAQRYNSLKHRPRPCKSAPFFRETT